MLHQNCQIDTARFKEDKRHYETPGLELRAVRGRGRDVGCGSWLCENAKTLHRDRRSHSPKAVLVAQSAYRFNLDIELKNIILRPASIFEFSHSQAH